MPERNSHNYSDILENPRIESRLFSARKVVVTSQGVKEELPMRVSDRLKRSKAARGTIKAISLFEKAFIG
ncbi:MAG TPA: hypothetical protein VKC89_01295 [Patescibacteria group bacterium]|nr:hypothetical protein [Patescibacteria group bacterium]